MKKLYSNGKIYISETLPFAEALVTENDTIIFAGSLQQAEQLHPAAETIDLQNRTVLPGLIDAHVHVIAGGQSLSQIDLRNVSSSEQFKECVLQKAKSLMPGEWILGGNWDHERWGGNLPSKSWVDSITPDNPLYLHRIDMHMGLANSCALKFASIDATTNDPPGGTIVKDEHGEPNGILKDAAAFMLLNKIPASTIEEYTMALANAQNHAVSLGITGMHDASIDRNDVSGLWIAAQKMNHAHQLKMRIGLRIAPGDSAIMAQLKNEYGSADEYLSFIGCKEFMDGSIGSTTALFFEPYSDDNSTCGLTLNDFSELERQLTTADAETLQISVHAIGDKANSLLLDMFERIELANGKRERRWRIEHAQHLKSADFQRYKKLGVIASVQPYHAADDGCWAEKRIGSERCKCTYAFKTYLNNNVPLAFGTDWTVAPLNPFLTIHAAVTRQTLDGKNPDGWIPEQKISLTQAIDAYTIGAAFAAFQENKVGRIAPGYLADFIVLDKDIFTITIDEIKNINVDLTIVGGKTVFSR